MNFRKLMEDSFIHPNEQELEGHFQCLSCRAIDQIVVYEEEEYTVVACTTCGVSMSFGQQGAEASGRD